VAAPKPSSSGTKTGTTSTQGYSISQQGY
jgi:hypothetical protein